MPKYMAVALSNFGNNFFYIIKHKAVKKVQTCFSHYWATDYWYFPTPTETI